MIKSYHIKIDAVDGPHLEGVIHSFDKKIDWKVSTNTESSNQLDYIVELTKYELLYLRLKCKTGLIIPIHKEENKIA